MGALNVDYEPVGAKVSLDGREVGISPMVLNDVLAGAHTVVVSAPEYESATLTATVNEGETAQLTGKLNKDEKKLIPFNSNGKHGWIDKTGQVVIPLKYDDAESFENGKARVKLNGEWFYIDKQGNRVK